MELEAWQVVLLVIVVVPLVLLLFVTKLLVFLAKLPLVVFRRVKSLLSRPFGSSPSNTNGLSPVEQSNDSQKSIDEKVLFWEQQDKINQELIPRVICQSELLARHIKDHENLPDFVARAVQAALAEARDEQRSQHEAALAAARIHAREQIEPDLVALEARLNASIEEKWETASRRYLLALVGISTTLAMMSVAALIVAIVV